MTQLAQTNWLLALPGEETQCAHCQRELDIGDRAYLDQRSNALFCTRFCADEDEDDYQFHFALFGAGARR